VQPYALGHGGASGTKVEEVATVIEVYGRVRSGDVGGLKSSANVGMYKLNPVDP
jgi:hypothetical protein